jgi:hypothetical protein
LRPSAAQAFNDEICELVVVEVEFPLECPIGQALAPLEQRDHLIDDLVEAHRAARNPLA